MPDRLEQRLRWLFSALALTFATVGTIFFLFPEGTVRVVSAAGAWFGYPAPKSAVPMRFWLGLAVAYMALVTILAAMLARDPRRHAHLMPILAAGKATSSLTCLAFFVAEPLPGGGRIFIYLLNFLVDGSLVLLVLGAWLALWLAPRPSDATRQRDEQILAPLLDVFAPRGGPVPLAASDPEIAARIAAYFASLNRRGALGLRLLLRAIEWLAPFYGQARFSRLDGAGREAFVERLAGSRLAPLRHLVAALKLVVTMHFYADERVARAIGFDGSYLEGKLLAGPNREAHRARLERERGREARTEGASAGGVHGERGQVSGDEHEIGAEDDWTTGIPASASVPREGRIPPLRVVRTGGGPSRM